MKKELATSMMAISLFASTGANAAFSQDEANKTLDLNKMEILENGMIKIDTVNVEPTLQVPSDGEEELLIADTICGFGCGGSQA